MMSKDSYPRYVQRIRDLGPVEGALYVCCCAEHALGLWRSAAGGDEGRHLLDLMWALAAGTSEDVHGLSEAMEAFAEHVPSIEDEYTPREELAMRTGVVILEAGDAVIEPEDAKAMKTAAMSIFDALVVADAIRRPDWRPEIDIVGQIDDSDGVSPELRDEWTLLNGAIDVLARGDYSIGELQRLHSFRGRSLTALYQVVLYG